MAATIQEQAVQTFEIVKEEEIAAPVDIVFETILEQMGPLNSTPEKPMPMKLEAWPGGRWFRDLKNNAGHLWGHVQVIKPPTLLEICGPMMMSYPAVNHLQYRFVADKGGTLLKFVHRGLGLILPDHLEGMPKGWGHWIEQIGRRAEGKSTQRKK